MKELTTFGANQQISGTGFLNPLQDIVFGAQKASKNNDLTSWVNGADVFAWQDKTGLATGSLLQVDATLSSWNDRVLWVLYSELTASTDGLGGANEYNFSTHVPRVTLGYTGTGGLTVGGADPSAGNPPVLASGKYMTNLDAANKLHLYSSTIDGSLKLYNDTGGTVFPFLIIVAFKAGLH